jgi:hypothetical protein
MGPRWIEKENTGLIEMRRRLSEELLNIPQFPEGILIHVSPNSFNY